MNSLTGHPVFGVQLVATRRGARLARRLAVQQLAAWGWPHGHAVSDAAAHLVAELAANAVTHGYVRGRDFRLRLSVNDDGRTLRIEVTDARPDRLPHTPTHPTNANAVSGRGLLLVETLADRWGTENSNLYTKTVWCELAVVSRRS
ncbi:ATP-binding protein [Streptomyces sp. NPDC050315]|uniref:ATP-binding protein n=1 Tax=Streptomyces sp. NPDC050315 TaxID=3155039 RepID=UPI00342F9976